MKEKELEKILKALANKRRILILKYLKSKKFASIGDISNEIKLSFKVTSKHVMILSNVYAVEKAQHNLSVMCRIPSTVHPSIKKLLEIL